MLLQNNKLVKPQEKKISCEVAILAKIELYEFFVYTPEREAIKKVEGDLFSDHVINDDTHKRSCDVLSF